MHDSRRRSKATVTDLSLILITGPFNSGDGLDVIQDSQGQSSVEFGAGWRRP